MFVLIVLSFDSYSQTIINAYAKVINISGVNLDLSNVNIANDDFLVGEEVIIMQMQDDIIGANTGNNSDFGNIAAIANAGLYEVATIASHTSGSTSLTLTKALTNSYNIGANSSVQIISYPKYTNYSTSGELTALAWNGNIGGVFAINVTNTLTLSDNISVDNLGFRGGVPNPTSDGSGCNATVFITNSNAHGRKGEGIYKSINTQYVAGRGKIANGGGGGSFHNGGGGGGGNFTNGGNGGPGWQSGSSTGCNPSAGGLGGVDLSDYISANRIFLGGGGGGGQQNNNVSPNGGTGGGIIFIKANAVSTLGGCGGISISSNGQSIASSGNDGGSGSGAGGSILFDVVTWDLNCQLDVFAAGGAGGNVNSGAAHGGGGGGGRGVIVLSGTAPVSNFTTSNTAGIGGTNSNNGTGGAAQSGQTSPSSPSADPDGIVESEQGPLPVKLLFWNGKAKESGVQLEWATATEIDNDYFSIDRSMNGKDWQTITIINGNGSTSDRNNYQYFDNYYTNKPTYYRLLQTDYDGESELFNTIVVQPNLHATNILLTPNPNDGHFAIQMSNLEEESLVDIQIFGSEGKSIEYNSLRIYNQIQFDLSDKPAGVYLLKITSFGDTKVMRVKIK